LNLQSRPAGSLIVQSSDTQPRKDLTRLMPSLSRVFLIDNRDGQRWLNDSGLTEIATFATGIGPAKALIDGHPEIVRAAHTRKLTVTPYTFTTRSPLEAGRRDRELPRMGGPHDLGV